MKRFLLVLFALISINAFAQSDSFKVKEGSFHHVQGCVTIPAHTDQNDLPMGVIKIITDNINEQQRARLSFEGNLAMGIEVEQHEGETWVYVTARAATFLRIKHPDFGVTEFNIPMEIEANKCYEMTLQYLNNNAPVNTYISVDSEPSGADIYIDGKHYGKTPNIITDLPMGKHEIKLEKQEYNPVTKIFIIEEGEKLKFNETLLSVYYKESAVEDDKVAAVEEEKPQKKEKPEKKPVEKVKPEKKAESLSKTSFLTLNAAYSLAPQMSFGFTYGQVKKLGWYVSAMSNFNFDAMGCEYECDMNGKIDGDIAFYTGETAGTRISVGGGVLYSISKPIYLKAGLGYGLRYIAWQGTDGSWVKNTYYSNKGVELDAGLMLSLGKINASFDGLVNMGGENGPSLEFKLGLGLNF
ncbi:MAG: PEGA domain-containing protein [Bacteroidales bacterium]|nr:PEGA domain-containing protein [Bacteroidales bacterium]